MSEIERQAARYRFLREGCYNDEILDTLVEVGGDPKNDEAFDAAVDKAMAEMGRDFDLNCDTADVPEVDAPHQQLMRYIERNIDAETAKGDEDLARFWRERRDEFATGGAVTVAETIPPREGAAERNDSDGVSAGVAANLQRGGWAVLAPDGRAWALNDFEALVASVRTDLASGVTAYTCLSVTADGRSCRSWCGDPKCAAGVRACDGGQG